MNVHEIKVSVIMSTYNENEYELRCAIESILNQSMHDFEFIIINDNPENKVLRELLSSFENCDKRIKIVVNEKNLGLAESLNKGIKLAKGKYIARMDADDIAVPTRLEMQVDYLESHEKCDIVCSNRTDINEAGKKIGDGTEFLIDDDAIPKILPYGSIIIHPTVMARKTAYEYLNGYRPMLAAQDYDMWLRAISAGLVFHIIPEKLLLYRVRDNSISKSNYTKQFYSSLYAVTLYKQRKNGHNDDFSLENLNKYLDKQRVNDKRFNLKFNNICQEFMVVKNSRNIKNIFKWFLHSLSCIQTYGFIIRGWKFKRALARYQK